ncbi:hypothetical protein ABZ912_19795 [Nonomuraea angiospora]|uniref:hypothetical protein n=1 Tax=Nonomuraea angiospora TaxID=46172 RepID=UPI0033DC67D4
MIWHAVYGLILAAVVAAEYVWLRPAARKRLHRVLIAPLRRRARNLRRSLAALDRAATFRPYRGHHTPRRTQP